MSFTFPCSSVCNVFVSNVFFTSRFKSSSMLLSVGVKFPDVSKDRWRPGSNPRSVHVGFVVDKMTLRQVYLRVLPVFPCHSPIYSSVTDAVYCQHIIDIVVKQESKDHTALSSVQIPHTS